MTSSSQTDADNLSVPKLYSRYKATHCMVLYLSLCPHCIAFFAYRLDPKGERPGRKSVPANDHLITHHVAFHYLLLDHGTHLQA
jgi:hypothetical protein